MIPRDPHLPPAPPSLDNTEELESEVRDLPNDHKTSAFPWSPPTLHTKSLSNFGRRESLLTRQLHSETEHTDDEVPLVAAARTARTQSTWSNPSVASTAELTSDDGHSVTSPSVSPPFPAANLSHALPLHVKPLDQKVKIVGQEDMTTAPANGEKTVEAGLGRKRCITFACRGKQEAVPERPSVSEAPTSEPAAPPPPQKRCSLKFVCPSRPTSESKPSEKSPSKRPSSPPPPARQASANAKAQVGKVHRGSDSTITHNSPKNTRRSPPTAAATPAPDAAEPPKTAHRRKYSTDSGESDDGEEAVRFHEFGTSDEEREDWVQESTCHRSRLTVTDTLKKENVIRKACEEVEEEAVEEDEEAEQELDAGLEDDDVDVADDDAEDDVLDDEDDDDESDEGFHSDDEEGFANSDDEEDDDSDLEWWRPGGISTAATSIEHLDRLAIVNSQNPEPGSSVGSASSGRISPHHRSSRSHRSRKSANTSAVSIPRQQRDPSPGLPDSTDFVCGTLDEDRPLEQAYLNRRKIREAAKHQVRPQDIDPSFPTSDPEMDEEDDEDLIDPTESEHDGFLHGELEEIHGNAGGGARKPSPRGRHRSNSHRSHSPPQSTARFHSPAPKKKSTARSPPPSTARFHSAAPKKKSIARSPPPTHHHRLFGRSPRRMRSPAPLNRMTSPPNSPAEQHNGPGFATTPHLAQRAHPPTRTASLPRRRVGLPSNKSGFPLGSGADRDGSFDGGKTPTSRDVSLSSSAAGDSEDSDTTTIASSSHHHHGYHHRQQHYKDHRRNAPTNKDAPTRRAAIDIVKGLDKKRQFRREKLYQKRCAAAAEKPHHGHGAAGDGEVVNKWPGRGAERMRAIGLGLQGYHGRAEHILSL